MAKGKKKDKAKKKGKGKLAKLETVVDDTSKTMKKAGKKAAAMAEKLASDAQTAAADIIRPKHAAGHWPDAEPVEEMSGAQEAAPAREHVAPKELQPADAPQKAPVTLEMPDEETLFSLSNLFKIFADPTRLRILYSLAEGPKCVADISAAAGVTQGATSHQLRSMKQEHLVDFVRDGKQVIYSLADDRVEALLAQGYAYISE